MPRIWTLAHAFIFTLVTLGHASSVFAASYQCTTEFGETVPLRKTVLNKGVTCEPCKTAGATIPPNMIDRALSAEWNTQVASDSSLRSKVKRKSLSAGDRQILLETRYATQKGPSFTFELNCAQGSDKCSGSFKDTPEANLIKIPVKTIDNRLSNRQGRAEISMSAREHLGWIIRLFKEVVPLDATSSTPVSGSGELKFFREDPLFIQDVGVDEPLHLIDSHRTRIAALEIKIRCVKQQP
jgi:hypothetical protein